MCMTYSKRGGITSDFVLFDNFVTQWYFSDLLIVISLPVVDYMTAADVVLRVYSICKNAFKDMTWDLCISWLYMRACSRPPTVVPGTDHGFH